MNHQNRSLYDSLLNSSSSITERLHLEISFPSIIKSHMPSKNKSYINEINDRKQITDKTRLYYDKSSKDVLYDEKSKIMRNKDISKIGETSLMFSFDANLKHQMEHFKYNELNEILEDDAQVAKNLYEEAIDDTKFFIEIPKFDITNKLMNLLITEFSYKRNIFIFFCFMTLLIRIFLLIYFHYSLYWDPEFNFLYLVLIYSPRFFYIISMGKVFFKTKSEDIFLERICDGFNRFDNAAQNIWEKDLNYDYQLKVGSISAKNITKFYKNKTQMFFKTLCKAIKPIFTRILLVMIPVEFIFLALLYVFRKDVGRLDLVKKLTIISFHLYHSYEIWCFAPCLILMTFNEDITGQALSISFTLDSIAFFLLSLEVLISLCWIIYLIFTHNENIVKGPKNFF